MNPYIDYYKHQAGTGLVGFEGVKYQKGHGFFGRLISSFAKPLLGYFGKKALKTGKDLASDILEGKNIKQSAKRRMKESFKEIGHDTLSYGKRKLDQLGTGKRRKTIKRKKVLKKAKKKIKPKKKHSVIKKRSLDLYLK